MLRLFQFFQKAGNQSIGVPSLRRGWRPWCAIRFCQHCTVPYSFSSSRSRFFFAHCLFFHPPCPPTLIFGGNDAFSHVHNRQSHRGKQSQSLYFHRFVKKWHIIWQFLTESFISLFLAGRRANLFFRSRIKIENYSSMYSSNLQKIHLQTS